jgi:hypothetical protein
MPFAPPLDPTSKGVRLVIEDSIGAILLDAMVPGGAYDVDTRVGWKVNRTVTSWTYRNPAGHPEGITLVGVKTVRSKPGLVKLHVKGMRALYPVDMGGLPLAATLVLDPPAAQTGQCMVATWAATPPTRPSCTATATGGTIKCRGQ